MRIGALFLAVIMAGCTSAVDSFYPPQDQWLSAHPYLPDSRTERREHPLGMMVYNKTGEVISEKQWADWFSIIDQAFRSFKKCIVLPDGLLDRELRSSDIVVFSQRLPRPNSQFVAFTLAHFRLFGFLPYESWDIFVHKDYFTLGNLRHEWIHVYSRLINEERLGHSHHLFAECENI